MTRRKFSQRDYDAIDRMQKHNLGGQFRDAVSDDTPIDEFRRRLVKRHVAAKMTLAKVAARKITWIFLQQGIKRGDLLVESNVYLNSIIRKYGIEPLLWDFTRKVIKEKLKEQA